MSDIEFNSLINELIENSIVSCSKDYEKKEEINSCKRCLQNIGEKEVICIRYIK